MIIIKLSGGLGNQLFQYALGRNLALKNKTTLLLDLSFYKSQQLRSYELGVFNTNAKVVTEKQKAFFFSSADASLVSKVLIRLKKLITNYKVVEEKQFAFSPEILSVQSPAYLDGYWQSENYFKEIGNIIRKEFIPAVSANAENKAMQEFIFNSDSVALHVRRGDYVSNPHTESIHGSCGPEYYSKAIEYIENKVAHPLFFIFSDDMEWVKKNIVIAGEKHYIDFNTADKSYEDMRLMSLCKHNIIANSSFSWWGAWLNANKDKIVVAPKRWFNDTSKDTTDLIPSSWISL